MRVLREMRIEHRTIYSFTLELWTSVLELSGKYCQGKREL